MISRHHITWTWSLKSHCQWRSHRGQITATSPFGNVGSHATLQIQIRVALFQPQLLKDQYSISPKWAYSFEGGDRMAQVVYLQDHQFQFLQYKSRIYSYPDESVGLLRDLYVKISILFLRPRFSKPYFESVEIHFVWQSIQALNIPLVCWKVCVHTRNLEPMTLQAITWTGLQEHLTSAKPVNRQPSDVFALHAS